MFAKKPVGPPEDGNAALKRLADEFHERPWKPKLSCINLCPALRSISRPKWSKPAYRRLTYRSSSADGPTQKLVTLAFKEKLTWSSRTGYVMTAVLFLLGIVLLLFGVLGPNDIGLADRESRWWVGRGTLFWMVPLRLAITAPPQLRAAHPRAPSRPR